jgi:deoxyribonuclease V
VEFVRQPRWDVPVPEAIAIQRELAKLVSLEDRVGELNLIGAVDLAVGRVGELGRAAAIVWRLSDGAVVEQVAIERPLTIPYIPGLLAFREGPLVEEALRLVRSEPDVLLVDGQGLAHPRRCGIACQLGVLLDRPTIGIGKSRLYGIDRVPGPNPGDCEPLVAPDGELLGVILRTRAGSKPLYVSPGSHVSPERAGEIVLACLRGHRLPEPVFLADRLSKDRPGRTAAVGDEL